MERCVGLPYITPSGIVEALSRVFGVCNIGWRHLNLRLSLRIRQFIRVQFDLVEEGEHPNRYAGMAQGDEPAIWLGILIQGNDKRGPDLLWLQNSGKNSSRILKSLNTCVGEIEGVPKEQTEERERRLLRPNFAKGQPKTIYY
jgi:hypothetical protein